MKSESKLQYSCKRKPDYIVFGALLMFILMVVFELYLTLIIPIHLRQQGTFEKQVAKEEMVSLLDVLRQRFEWIEYSGSLKKGEIELVKGVLDTYALYLREHQDELTLKQIRDLTRVFSYYDAIQQGWIKDRYHLNREVIPYPELLKRIEQKTGRELENRIEL